MLSLSKNKIKYIRSLEQKKIRKEEKVFLAEGPKLVGDLLGCFSCRFLAATSSWLRASVGCGKRGGRGQPGRFIACQPFENAAASTCHI